METDHQDIHWSDEKEVVRTNKPLKLILIMLKHLPSPAVLWLIYPISFFYLIFSKRARVDARTYQKQLKEYTGGEIPAKISPYKQILSFSLCVVEKMEGWLGKFDYNRLIKHDDDLDTILADLNKGQGALVIGSHLGNMELLRSISSMNSAGADRKVPVTALMELNGTQMFNKTLREISPNVDMNVIDSRNIGPDTICQLQDTIENGGIIFLAGDRTSATTRNRVIKEKFLGREAEFPYGIFMLASLLNAPTYYIFGLRTKIATIHPVNNIFIEKSKVDFNCKRSEREERIRDLCREYISKLEKYCKLYPYQWYNFFNFWMVSDENKTE